MRFKNTAQHPLDFRLGGQRHTVQVGGEVEISDALTSSVTSRRLPLEPIPGTEGAAPEPKPRDDEKPAVGTPARLWYDRAHQVRDALDALQKQHAAVLDGMSEERAEAQAKVEATDAQLAEAAAFLAKVRERLGIAPEESILEAIDALKTEAIKLRADLDSATRPTPRARGGTSNG